VANAYYRDRLHSADLAERQLMVESRRAPGAPTGILDLGQGFCPFRRYFGDIYCGYVTTKPATPLGDTYLQHKFPAHPPRSRISAAGNRRDSGASSEPSWTA